jgi:hypothetical protein
MGKQRNAYGLLVGNRCAMDSTGLLRTGTSGGFLWTWRWTLDFHKMLGSSWVAAQLAASRGLGGFSRTQLHEVSLVIRKTGLNYVLSCESGSFVIGPINYTAHITELSQNQTPYENAKRLNLRNNWGGGGGNKRKYLHCWGRNTQMHFF